MAPWKLIATPLVLVSLFAASCGDGPDPVPTPTPTQERSSWSQPPVLGGNVLVVSPEHASSVPRSATAMVGEASPRGVCAEVSFQDLPQSGQWFRMAVDGVEVTASSDIYWFISSQDAEGGTICYAPAAGLEPGRHTAAIAVQNPTNPAADARQTVGWEFEVTP
jgi:hypothetical protein